MRLKPPVRKTKTDVPTSASLKIEKTPGQRKVGNTGKYEELRAGTGKGGFLDKKDAHHVVPQRYLKAHNIDTQKGLSVVLPKEMHKKTRSHGPKAKRFALDQTFRNATAEGLKDLIQLEKEHGVYESGGRESLLKGLRNHKKQQPKLYKKGRN